MGEKTRFIRAGWVGACALVTAVTMAFSAAPSRANPTTWMAGPGCGSHAEWRQHPANFPYFCEGAAYVEHARWRDWGKATATAHATMNEADLRHGASVGTAPRVRSAVTITASHIEICGGKRAYTRIIIKFGKSHKGLHTLHYPSNLPQCSAASSPTGPASPPLWSALGGSVRCGPTATTPTKLLCNSRAIPAPSNSEVGDPGFVFLTATGAPTVVRLGGLLWPSYGPFTPLSTGATWTDPALHITCSVGESEVRCSNSSGNGFTISQSSYTPF